MKILRLNTQSRKKDESSRRTHGERSPTFCIARVSNFAGMVRTSTSVHRLDTLATRTYYRYWVSIRFRLNFPEYNWQVLSAG